MSQQSSGEASPADRTPTGTPADSAAGAELLPLNAAAPEFTLRAILTGMALGGLLSICNVYLGLKSGLVINMSIVAALLGYGFWAAARGSSGGRLRSWGILENNINQTASSAGASVASAGLVHAVPALAIMTGQELAWHELALWTLSVCLVGITVAIALRRHLVLVSELRFPVGVASAEMLREMHSRGGEAMARVVTLICFAVAASGVYLAKVFAAIPAWGLPFSIRGLKAKALTFSVDPALLWVGVGGLIGFRACASVMIGCVLALGVLAPILVDNGTIHTTLQNPTYSELQSWLLWPGTALMVVSSLTSLALSWRSFAAALHGDRNNQRVRNTTVHDGIPRKWFAAGVLLALAFSAALQVSLFHIVLWAAVTSVLLAFVLAVVAARVSGETGITPVGSMGKVSQIIFGALIPRSAVPNLMAANVAGGAASQCADLLHDLKCGQLLGASARLQSIAQICGAAVGALVGSAAYLILIPNPQEQLVVSPEWPAPGAAVWRAVAELFKEGFGAMPAGATQAMLLGAVAGLVLAVVEKIAPRRVRPFTLSPASLGLAFVIPANYSISLFLGGTAALIVTAASPSWSRRFLVAACAGIVAGESLTGVGISLGRLLLP